MRNVLWRASRLVYKRLIPDHRQHVVRRLVGRSLVPFYLGNRVQCPCCQWKFRSFLPAGVAGRPNARCRVCGSLERTRLVALYLRERTDIFTAPTRLLHVAPERSLQDMFVAAPNIEYVSLDLASPLASIRSDITSLPFSHEQFDAILCMHVLEHVDDDRAGIRELFRVLKRDGFAIVQVPIDLTRAQTYEDPSVRLPSDREREFGQEDHVRVYGQDYVDRLKEGGFAVCERDYSTEVGVESRQRFGLQDELIYECWKP
jgi:SAM-dependent methyltransferase